jgi:hypothetical protein
MSQQHKRQLRNYLLDARYQMRFTLFMVAVCALLMSGLGYMVMRKADAATKIAIAQVETKATTLIAAGKDADKVLAETAEEVVHLDARRRLLGWVLVGTGFLLCAGLFFYGIKMTHRVAGPLHKVSTYLDKVKDGKFDKVWGLRKGDHLVEFYEHFREAHEALRQGQEADVDRLRDVIASVERSDLPARSAEIAAGLADLKALLAAKEASLG